MIDKPTPAQLQKLAILRNERYGTRDKWFAMVAFELGKEVTSNKQLSFQDAHHLLTVLDAPLATETAS